MVLNFPTSNGVFRGLIYYLVKNRRNRLLGIKSSGKYAANYKDASALLNQSAPFYYTEMNSSYGQWVMIWLNNKCSIDIEGYSIKCGYTPEAPNYWNFSVSSDGASWDVLHSGSTVVSEAGNIFEARAKTIRYFKWTITGNSAGGLNYVLIACLDVYGKFHCCFSRAASNVVSKPTFVLMILLVMIC